MLPVLYIGRFQPFHLGHLDAVSQILERESEIIIAIGSAEVSHTYENPFTASERYQLIDITLQKTQFGMHIPVIPVHDINDNSLWVSHLERFLPPFSRVYSSSPLVKELFAENGTHEVIPLEFRKKISGTAIRKAIIEGQAWEKMVSPDVADMMKNFNARERLIACK